MNARDRPVAIWLSLGCLLIALMVTVGGITRLTGSGLSITEWNVVTGTLPPLHQADWQALFAKYQETPQFRELNAHFDLTDFKRIFWWEYIHRLLGRLIGVVFLVPYLIFLWSGRITGRRAARLGSLFLLGGLQGGLGWFMVASGLVDDPAVSHFRLAAHLLLAFTTLGVTLWFALDYLAPARSSTAGEPRTRGWVFPLAALVVLQITWGAFVAGLRAGFQYNTFPTMAGFWLPPGGGTRTPWLSNLVSNPATVQFVHRWLGILIGLVAATWWVARGRHVVRVRVPGGALALVAVGQGALGVLTLLLLPAHPVLMGALHQAGGLLLFGTLVWVLHGVGRGGTDRGGEPASRGEAGATRSK